MLNDELYNKRVVVIGDSFTYIHTDYTWLVSLRNNYNWQMTNLSVPGSGCKYAWYTFIKYLKEFDVCIFAWSESTRMFHKHLPHLNASEANLKQQMSGAHQNPIYEAAQGYYRHLMDMDFDDYTAKAMLFWLDAELKKQYSDKMFFHFHSFPAGDPYTMKTEKITDLMHQFENGINIAPSLYSISKADPAAPKDYAFDTREGHLSPDLHTSLYDSIISYAKTHEYANGDIIQLLK